MAPDDERRRLTAGLKAQARALGFHLVGVASPEPFPTAEHELVRWLHEGHQGEMAWMNEARARLACRPHELLPGAQSLVVVGVCYRTENAADADADADEALDAAAPSRGRVARYAWGRDYHDVLKQRLRALQAWLTDQLQLPAEPERPASRIFVDDGPLVERDAAVRAGLGFRGKNTNLLSPLGSYVLLGALLSTVALAFDQPQDKSCGACRLCIDACPTDALAQPYHLAAERCIAYLTIEHRSSVPEPLREKMGAWVFGCDVCQEVCPYNASQKRRPRAWPELEREREREVDLEARAAVSRTPPLRELLDLDEEGFRTAFRGSPVKRAKRRGLVRNAAIAAANQGDLTARPSLERLAAEDADAVVRETAAWAWTQLDRPSPPPAL